MTKLAKVGKALRECIVLGRLEPGTLGYRAAVSRSRAALTELSEMGWGGLTEIVERVCRRAGMPERERVDPRAGSTAR